MNLGSEIVSDSRDRIRLTKEQSTKIQILRGLAIIAVVFIHNTPDGLAQVWGRPFMNFCVGLFLFLSGLLSSAEHWNPKKRIIKVAIPYVIWTLVYAVMANIMDNPASIPGVFAREFILANAAAPMYYVFVYCEFTLLIPLIDKLARSKAYWIGFIIAPIEIVLMRYLPLYMGFEVNKYIGYIMHVSCLGWFTYFYLGYLIGNGILKVNVSRAKLITAWGISIALQIAEGYAQYFAGEVNCGTQLKLTSILSGAIFAILAYKYIVDDKAPTSIKALKKLGDDSFGIFFSHIAVMMVLSHIPYYSEYVPFPIKAIFVVFVTCLCVELGKRILGKYAKYLAL